MKDLANSKETQYLAVRLQDVYNDKMFRKQVNWVKVIQEFQKNFPREKTFDWEKVESKLVAFVMKKLALSRSSSLFCKGLLKIKEDYFSFKEKVHKRAELKKMEEKIKAQKNREIKTAVQKETVMTKTVNKNIHNNSNGNLTKTITKSSPIEKEKVRNLTTNYIPFSKIVKDKQFVKLTGMSTLQFPKNTNWKQFDTKLINYMITRLLNRVNLNSKESLLLRRFEEIEYSYQHYSKYKNVKETVKSLDAIIPKKVEVVKKDISRVSGNKVTNSKNTLNKQNQCTEQCVSICQNYFPKYKDFIDCSSKACSCSEYDVISN